jgi:putative SOS response-associated peptidase YedK
MCFSVEVETDLKKLSKSFDAQINSTAFDYYHQLQKKRPSQYKYVYPDDHRIYAKTWAPIICKVRGKREIRPMRYQLLPYFSPTQKYTRKNPKTGRDVEIKGTYNARLESLMQAKAWERPFLRQHGVIAIKQFFEWVEKDQQKKLISFNPQNETYLLAPCLYDTWYSKDKKIIIQSFAIITTTPAPEVQAMGHDRTPVNLRPENLNAWLSPEKHSKNEILSILNNPQESYYEHHWV